MGIIIHNSLFTNNFLFICVFLDPFLWLINHILSNGSLNCFTISKIKFYLFFKLKKNYDSELSDIKKLLHFINFGYEIGVNLGVVEKLYAVFIPKLP